MRSPGSTATLAVILVVGCSGSVRRSLDTLEEDNVEVAVNVNSKDPSADASVRGGDASSEAGDGGRTDGEPLAECGNGDIEGDEACDDGEANSNEAPGACRLNCTLPRCGDGVVDDGEACDEGEANSDNEPDACRTDCGLPRCGDGVPDKGEECDTGSARSDTKPDACRLDCRDYRCGDGVRDSNEPCKRGEPGCNDDCTFASCGNGDVDDGEECDDGNDESGDACQPSCLIPRCGDGFVDPGEECDDSNSNNNDGCRTNCKKGCKNASDCANEPFCDGAEQCVDGICEAGRPPAQRDGPACVTYMCDEAKDAVVASLDHGMCANHGRSECHPQTATKTTYPGRCDEQRGCIQAGDGISEPCPTPASVCESDADGRIDADVSTYYVTFRPTCDRTETDCSAVAERQPCPRSRCASQTTVLHGEPYCDINEGCGLNPDGDIKEETCRASFCQNGQLCRSACVVDEKNEAGCRSACQPCPNGACVDTGREGPHCAGSVLPLDGGIIRPPIDTLAP